MKNRNVCGFRELLKTARRAGLTIGRDQTVRLMRSLGSEDVERLKRVKTKTSDLAATRHSGLVKRDFTATAPNLLWVTDLRFVLA